jgi:autotransporter-associated beta strand protein
VTVNAGTLRLGSITGLGPTSVAVTVMNNARLDLAGFSPSISGLSDTLSLGALGSALVTNTGAKATLTITRASKSFGGTIAGPIDLVIPAGSSGYQILSGTNSYTGLTTVYSALEAWSTNALGATSAGTILTNNSTLVLKGTSNPMTYAPEPLTVYGSSYLGINVDATLRSATWTGPITLASGSTLSFQLQGSSTSSLAVVSSITGPGAISKSDSKMVLLLSGANDFGGGTTLGAGPLILGSATALGTGSVTVTSGLIDLNGNSATLGSLSGGSSSAIIDTSAGSGTTTLTINQTTAGTMSGALSNGLTKTLALVKTGPASLTLNNTNTFTGAATISGGTLKIGTQSALQNVGNIAVTSGGTLDLNAQSLNDNVRTISIAGPGASGQSGALANTGNSTEAQIYKLTLTGDATVGSTGSKLNVYNLLNGGGYSLTVAGTYEVNIRLNNAFQNLTGITINSGLLRLESSQAWTGTYTVNPGGKLDTYGAGRIEAGNVFLNGGRLANGGTGQMPAFWSGAFSLSGTTVVDTVGGNISISNAVSGTGGLIKISTNTLAVTGACTFDGALCVTNGTFTLNGSMAHANILVASNAVFNGSGTLHARIVNDTPDAMVVNGSADISKFALDLDVTGALTPGHGPYTLVDATHGTLIGRFVRTYDVPSGYAVAQYGNTVQLVSAGTLIRLY